MSQSVFYSCNSYNSLGVHTAVLRIILVSCLKWQLDTYTENTEYNTEGLVCTTCTSRCQHYILQSSSRIIFQTTVLYKLKNTRFSSHKIHNYYRSWPQCHQLSARLSYVEPQWWVEGATGAGSCWSQALNLLYNILQLKFNTSIFLRRGLCTHICTSIEQFNVVFQFILAHIQKLSLNK